LAISYVHVLPAATPFAELAGPLGVVGTELGRARRVGNVRSSCESDPTFPGACLTITFSVRSASAKRSSRICASASRRPDSGSPGVLSSPALERRQLLELTCEAPAAPADLGLLSNDPELGVDWPRTAEEALLGEKDRKRPQFRDLPGRFARPGGDA
jgi:hypothetical protein